MMKLAEGSDADGKFPLGKEEREDLLASVMNGLKRESDVVLKSVSQVVQDLKENAGMREALESFYENGWAFIQKTGKSENEIKVERSTLSSTALALAKPKKLTSRLDHETHPMHIEHVLKKIFEYSSVESLKNFRLVSTEWRDLSLSSWREKAVLCVNAVVDDDDDEAEDFIQDGSEFRELPFKKYKLFYAPHYLCFEAKRTFLNTFASSIQSMYLISRDLKTMFSLLTKLPELRVVSLEFDADDFSMEYESLISDRGRCPFRKMQPATSKLELELKLSLMNYNRSNRWEAGIGFPWEKLFRMVPSIDSLRVKYKPEMGRSYRRINDLDLRTFDEILRSLCQVRKKGNLSTLKLEELDILDAQQHPLLRSNPLTDVDATNIIKSKLPLRTLAIHIGTIGSNESRFTISNLLEAHATTLEFMKCESDPDTNYLKKKALKIPFPSYLPAKVLLPNLTELVFVTGCIWAFHVLGSLDVPNLESLRIEPNRPTTKKETDRQLDLKTIVSVSKKSFKTFSGASFLPNLKKFFYGGPRRFTRTELRGLGKAMPNVTDLGIPLCDVGVFWIVYELWPGLESLHLLISERTYLLFDDYVVTGLPCENDGDGVSVESRKPNITNLKELRKFVLEARLDENFPWPRRPLITDRSAVSGFLQLPMLRVLQLETLCKFSAKIQADLESHVLEMKLKCPGTDNDNDEGDDDEDDGSCSDGSEDKFRDPRPFNNLEETDDDVSLSDDTDFDTESDSDSDSEMLRSEDDDNEADWADLDE